MSATLSTKDNKPLIRDRRSDLQRKIQLLEGERRAQHESSQSVMKKNRERIRLLRKENELLHRKLAEALSGDELVVNEAYQSQALEKAAFRKMSGQVAVQFLDQKVCDKVKKLNAVKHTVIKQHHHLEELNTEYNTMRINKSSLLPDGVTRNLRVLENRLEKTQLKCQEVECIMKSYQTIKVHLQMESVMFQPQLDAVENKIIQQQQQLRELLRLNNNAHSAKDTAKVQLECQELMAYGERRQRDLLLNNYRKRAEEEKTRTDQGERRVQRVMLHTDELNSEAQHSGSTEEENYKTTSSFQEAFRYITECTGVTDTQEVVVWIKSQHDTHTHLEYMKVLNECELQRLKKESEVVYTEYQNTKYSGEAKLKHGRRILEECVSDLQRKEQRRETAKKTLEKRTHMLNTMSNALEQLCNKLQHVSLQNTPVYREHVYPLPILVLLQEAELKVMQLNNELQGQDFHTLEKEMKEEEFHARIEEKLPDYNTRITLPDHRIAHLYEGSLFAEEDQSGDDDDDDDDGGGGGGGEVITRAFLKRQSQLIIESRTKRKTQPRKRKNKL